MCIIYISIILVTFFYSWFDGCMNRFDTEDSLECVVCPKLCCWHCQWQDVKIQELFLTYLKGPVQLSIPQVIQRQVSFPQPKLSIRLQSHLVRTQSWNVLPLKPGVGQFVAIHATLTARNFFLAHFYPPSPFTCILFQNCFPFLPVLAVVGWLVSWYF